MQDDSLNSIYSLPVYAQREQIVESVNNNQVTIITAETGAGKSTQVPQYLAEAGYTKIVVTQPRILAARSLCMRVRQEFSWRSQADCLDKVGYRTAHEKDDSPDNVILYCTDGLQLVRELTGSGVRGKQVLILDEIHEWNENMEVLIAWAKKRCKEEPDFKLVLMSATIEAETLARFFGNFTPITVPGRSHGVTFVQSRDLYTTIEQEIATEGSNILVFLPGKAEIEQAINMIRSMGTQMPVLPLHSQLEADEQQKVFAHYPSGKIVLATNIAQTSITIDDIDIVIDSGLERRIEIKDGVEGLFIAETSQADCMQRAGRAGRTKPGRYIMAQLGSMPCTPLEKRARYGIPEIMRTHIDRLVLRLSSAGLDIEQLQFFHAPSSGAVTRAKKVLTSLGALRDGNLTDIGTKMERFPVESTYARMLVQAADLPKNTLRKLAAIIAIQEVGGIVKGGPRTTGWQLFTKQKKSDLLAQYDVLLHIPELQEYELEPYGIVAKNVEKAAEVELRLLEALAIYDEPESTTHEPILAEEETPLLRCIVAGQLHQLWTLDPEGIATHISTGQQRELSSTTVLRWVGLCAGTPFDLEVAGFDGRTTLHLVNDLTAVDPLWLSELAPEDFELSSGKIVYEPRLGALVSPVFVRHRGKVFETTGAPVFERTPQNQRLFVNLYALWVQKQLERERELLRGPAARRIPNISLKEIEHRVFRISHGAVSAAELPKKTRIQLTSLTKLVTWHGEAVMSRHTHHGHEQRRQGWQDKHHSKDRWRRRD